jgi:methionine-rich copper-binding protein CopC
MKHLHIPLAAALFSTAAYAQISRYDLPEGETCGCGKAHALMLRAAAGLPIGEDGARAPSYGDREAFADTDLISNDLDFEVVPSTGFISGSNTMLVESRVNGLTQFTVMLRNNFTASATLNGATPATMSGPPSGSYARTITLDRPYNVGERFTVRVNYSGTAVSRGFGSIEFGSTGAGDPIVASLSEAYFAATWFPAKDGDVFQPGDNSDKSTWRIAITAPDTLRSVSNGLLIGEDTLSGARKRYRWETNYPMSTYLAAFCSTVYNTWTLTYSYPLAGGGTGTMPVEFNIYPGSDNPGNRAAWSRVIDMFPAFRGVYGEYPFINEKYGIYQFPFGGGMEHQTNTGQGTFNESVTAHELAHQWWGDDVTCKYWNDIWLNEGSATYGEALWEERKPGSSGTPALHAAMAARRPGAVSDSVYVYNASIGNMSRIFSSTYSYRKGAWVHHMLRHVLGDATYFQGLADYRAAFSGSAATTDDFRSVMSDTSGRDLTEYFQQWVYGGGAPQYTYSWQAATINGAPYLRLRIDQTQDITWGINGAFKMPVDVRINTASGSTTSVVDNTLRSQYFLVPAPGAVTGIVLDEFDWILNTGKTSTAYVAGPPKIIAATPAIASAPLDVAQVTVTFSDNVAATAGAFTVTGPSGPVPFTYSYNATQQRATLAFASSLAPGAYTVNVAQTITANGGQSLDGETATAFPSGNGAAGGAASWSFTIENPCTADYNNDGGVDGDDVIAYFADWDSGLIAADFNNDGGVDGDDVIEFFGAWDLGC